MMYYVGLAYSQDYSDYEVLTRSYVGGFRISTASKLKLYTKKHLVCIL